MHLWYLRNIRATKVFHALMKLRLKFFKHCDRVVFMNLSRKFLVIFVCCCIVIGASFGAVHYIATNKSATKQNTIVYIPSGSGLLRVSWILKNNGLIHTPWHFRLISSLKGENGSLRAGEFEIMAGASVEDILLTITKGELYKRLLTIPEGSSNIQVAEILDMAPGLEKPTIMPEEGYLLPDTYFYHYGSKSSDILEQMAQKLTFELDLLWYQRPDDFPLMSKHELLTLASIVEKETSLDRERTRVAAVFLNRLKKGMRLQSDPTVIYGITGGKLLDRRLTKADIKQKTEYNTYRINGLPPGPIANPGIASIKAVLMAEPVKDLYFVADGTGGHAFATTLRDHNRNVKK